MTLFVCKLLGSKFLQSFNAAQITPVRRLYAIIRHITAILYVGISWEFVLDYFKLTQAKNISAPPTIFSWIFYSKLQRKTPQFS